MYIYIYIYIHLCILYIMTDHHDCSGRTGVLRSSATGPMAIFDPIFAPKNEERATSSKMEGDFFEDGGGFHRRATNPLNFAICLKCAHVARLCNML